MKLSIYGKKTVQVLREGETWVLYVVADGKRMRSNDIVIPGHYSEDQAIVFIADMFHEAATPEFPDIKRID